MVVINSNQLAFTRIQRCMKKNSLRRIPVLFSPDASLLFSFFLSDDFNLW